jgi:hypothetical protein
VRVLLEMMIIVFNIANTLNSIDHALSSESALDAPHEAR